MHMYRQNGIFDDKERNRLVHIVCTFVMDSGLKINLEVKKSLARQILEIFPNEPEVLSFKMVFLFIILMIY